MSLQKVIRNFGRNVWFRPRRVVAPRSEQEVLDLLDENANGKIRVVGSRHAWSPAIVTDDVLIDLQHFDEVEIDTDAAGDVWATIGGGCQIKRALVELQTRANATLPALGMITEQTLAGATATGTHGSGRNSLSHYLEEVRLAAFDPDTGKARIFVIRGGQDLQAARCALGCMGVVLRVRLRCIPQYLISECIVRYDKIEDILAQEERFPRQHFFLLPHTWDWFGLHQCALAPRVGHVSRFTWLFRLYSVLFLDIAFHLTLTALLKLPRKAELLRGYFRKVVPRIVLQNRTFVARSDHFLTIHIERIRHFEMELFVTRTHLLDAARYVQDILSYADGATNSIAPDFRVELEQIGMRHDLERLHGTFTHHYPVTFRRVLPDDTLISMASGVEEPWYAMSLITYDEPKNGFLPVADFLAHSMAALFGMRAHWGKHCPLTADETDRLYPKLALFREICNRYDAKGVFRNGYCQRVLGFAEATAAHDHTPGFVDSASHH